MAYNSSDEKQVSKAKKKAALDDALRLNVVKEVMADALGRRWIYGMLESAHIFHTSFVQGMPDATAFKEGERNHGLRLLADVQEAAPESYLTMIREAKEESA